MTQQYEDTKKLTVDLERKSVDRLNSYMTWGVKRHVIQCLVDDLNDMLEEHGGKLIGAILDRTIHAQDVLDVDIEEPEDD